MNGPWIAAFLALWALTLLLAFLVLGLLRRVNSILEAAESRVTNALTGTGSGGIAPGSKVPDFEATWDGGQAVSSQDLLAEPAVFLFMETGCAPCRDLAGRLDGIDGRLDDVALYVVLEDVPGSRELGIPAGVNVLYQRGGVVSSAFEARATPQAFAVDAGGTVLEKTIPGRVEHLRQLARRCRQASAAGGRDTPADVRGGGAGGS